MSEKDCKSKGARDNAQCDAANAEYLERDAANVAWMTASFAQAKAVNAAGIVIVTQGDPGFDVPETEEFDESTNASSSFQNFMGKLVEQTAQFKGQVLFVHGDTHFFKMDKPLYKTYKMLTNFTRVQTFGSPSLHWVRVAVDTKTPHVFTVIPVTVKHPL